MTLPTAAEKRAAALKARERAEQQAVQFISQAIDDAAAKGEMFVDFLPRSIPQDLSSVRWAVVLAGFQEAGFQVRRTNDIDTFSISWSDPTLS